jgi:hypothetical protein
MKQFVDLKGELEDKATGIFTSTGTIHGGQETSTTLLRISHHLDYETSERKTIYYRLQEITILTKKAVENQMKGRASRESFVPYLVGGGTVRLSTGMPIAMKNSSCPAGVHMHKM